MTVLGVFLCCMIIGFGICLIFLKSSNEDVEDEC